MSGSRNIINASKWKPDQAEVKRLLVRFRRHFERSAPTIVHEASCRIEASLDGGSDPKSEDMGIVMLWLMSCEDLRRRERSSRKPSSASEKKSWASDPHVPIQKTRVRPNKESKVAQGRIPTGFSKHIEEQSTESVRSKQLRSRFGISRSRTTVQSDGSGRRVVISGDKSD